MNKMLFGVLLLVAGSVNAIDSQAMAYCSGLERSARSTMEARQNGAAMADILRVLEGVNAKMAASGKMTAEQLEAHSAVYEGMVIEAFSAPHFQTQHHKDREVGDFANRYMRDCLKTWNK
jgi:hypothetical protein